MTNHLSTHTLLKPLFGVGIEGMGEDGISISNLVGGKREEFKINRTLCTVCQLFLLISLSLSSFLLYLSSRNTFFLIYFHSFYQLISIQPIFFSLTNSA